MILENKLNLTDQAALARGMTLGSVQEFIIFMNLSQIYIKNSDLKLTL